MSHHHWWGNINWSKKLRSIPFSKFKCQIFHRNRGWKNIMVLITIMMNLQLIKLGKGCHTILRNFRCTNCQAEVWKFRWSTNLLLRKHMSPSLSTIRCIHIHFKNHIHNKVQHKESYMDCRGEVVERTNKTTHKPLLTTHLIKQETQNSFQIIVQNLSHHLFSKV